jgi:predicted  nucleic acid-binding Zn-ribbon protein
MELTRTVAEFKKEKIELKKEITILKENLERTKTHGEATRRVLEKLLEREEKERTKVNMHERVIKRLESELKATKEGVTKQTSEQNSLKEEVAKHSSAVELYKTAKVATDEEVQKISSIATGNHKGVQRIETELRTAQTEIEGKLAKIQEELKQVNKKNEKTDQRVKTYASIAASGLPPKANSAAVREEEKNNTNKIKGGRLPQEARLPNWGMFPTYLKPKSDAPLDKKRLVRTINEQIPNGSAKAVMQTRRGNLKVLFKNEEHANPEHVEKWLDPLKKEYDLLNVQPWIPAVLKWVKKGIDMKTLKQVIEEENNVTLEREPIPLMRKGPYDSKGTTQSVKLHLANEEQYSQLQKLGVLVDADVKTLFTWEDTPRSLGRRRAPWQYRQLATTTPKGAAVLESATTETWEANTVTIDDGYETAEEDITICGNHCESGGSVQQC